jgi:hypothetical protein
VYCKDLCDAQCDNKQQEAREGQIEHRYTNEQGNDADCTEKQVHTPYACHFGASELSTAGEAGLTASKHCIVG